MATAKVDMDVQVRTLEAILKHPDNRECADCNSKTPRWASTCLGLFVCLRCSGKSFCRYSVATCSSLLTRNIGFHRNLTVTFTKVRSVNLDKWEHHMLELYKNMNNKIANAYWEARMPSSFVKPTA